MGIVQASIVAIRTCIIAMEMVLFMRVLSSFFPIPRNSKPYQFLFLTSEPLLSPVRKLLLMQAKEKKLNFDISPLVVMIILHMINILIKRYMDQNF